MKVSELIAFFSTFTRLPVPINDVLEHILERGVRDRILLIEVEMDTGIVRGFLFQYERLRAYDGDAECAEIYYGEDQEPEWQRLVCCKELLHLLDNGDRATATREDVGKLISELVLPPTLQNISAAGIHSLDDQLGMFRALAVLFPMDARNELMESYQKGLLNDEDIAKLAQIPLKFVRFLMSDSWDRVHEILTRGAPSGPRRA
jgi:hypothetical protein